MWVLRVQNLKFILLGCQISQKINSMIGPKSKSLRTQLYVAEIFLIHNEEWCVAKHWKPLCIVCIHKVMLIKNALLVTTCYLFNLVLYCSAVLFLSSFFSKAHYSSLWTIWPEIYSEHLISVLAIPWGKTLMSMFMTNQQSFPVIFSWTFLTFCILKMQLGDSQLWCYKATRGLHLIRQKRPLCSNS